MTGLTALLVLALGSALPFSTAPAAHWAADEPSKQLTIRGALVILDDAGRVIATPSADEHRPGNQAIGLRSTDGPVYQFLSTDPLIEMVGDPQLWQMTLQLTVRPIKDQQVQIVKIQSIRGGKLFDLYYFCDVCNITAYAPGPCPCCRKDVELIETSAQVPDL